MAGDGRTFHRSHVAHTAPSIRRRITVQPLLPPAFLIYPNPEVLAWDWRHVQDKNYALGPLLAFVNQD